MAAARAGGAESEHLPHDRVLYFRPDRFGRRQTCELRIDEVEIACFQVIAESLLTAGAVTLPAEKIVEHHAVESGFDRDADDFFEISRWNSLVLRDGIPAEVVALVGLKRAVVSAGCPFLEIRNFPLHQFVVERGELNVGEHGDMVSVGGGEGFLQPRQVLLLLFPAHSLVEVAVQNIGADLLHTGEGLLRIESAVP